MKNPIIIDSSAFISLDTITDGNYKKATAISRRIREEDRTIVMPGEIFIHVLQKEKALQM